MTLHIADDPKLWELAIESVLDQDVEGATVEIHLCVDGPVSDAHEALLERYTGHIQKVLRNERCVGLSASLNRIIDGIGDADFVFRMDGDDISLPGRFAAQIAALERQPNVDLIGCQAWDIAADGRRLRPRDYPTEVGDARALLARQNPVLHPTFCLRGSVLRDKDVRYPKAFLTEDLAFLVELAARGYRFASIPERLFEWRIAADFYRRRRSLRRGLAELVWYSRAVHMIHGPMSWRYAFPIARLILRCLPARLARSAYESSLRSSN